MEPARDKQPKKQRNATIKKYKAGLISIEEVMQGLQYNGSKKPEPSDYPSTPGGHRQYKVDRQKWGIHNNTDCYLKELERNIRPYKTERIRERYATDPAFLEKHRAYSKEYYKDGEYYKARYREIYVSALEKHNYESVVSGTLPPDQRPAFHHIIPFSKLLNPGFVYRAEEKILLEMTKCVLLTNSEHLYYHGYTAKQFGKGQYPTPVYWPNHFWTWVLQFRKERGVNNINPTGQFNYWPALRYD